MYNTSPSPPALVPGGAQGKATRGGGGQGTESTQYWVQYGVLSGKPGHVGKDESRWPGFNPVVPGSPLESGGESNEKRGAH